MAMGSEAMGMGMGRSIPDWMAALGGPMGAQAGLRSPGASARFPANVTSQALAVSASTSGFLIAGALQLNHWALSSLLQTFQVGYGSLSTLEGFAWLFCRFSADRDSRCHTLFLKARNLLPWPPSVAYRWWRLFSDSS